MSSPLLTVERLSVAAGKRRIVRGISFEICRAETLALVGESGSGKSITALTIARLLPPAVQVLGGRVCFAGRDLLRIPEREMLRYRGRRIGFIFQDPLTALNPIMTVGEQLAEAVHRHFGLRGQALRKRCLDLLEQVHLPNPEMRLESYPHQLSGGQRQRVVIALALAGEPDLLIADEPTTALDAPLQRQILQLLKEIQEQRGLALLFITHDLRLVEAIADSAAVMQQGEIVETFVRSGRRLFGTPKHPYTQKLLAALPSPRKQPKPLSLDTRNILEVRDLKVWYPIRKGLLRRVAGYIKAVDGISLEVKEGETVALIGPSGCGKTTLGKAIVGLVPKSGGEILLEGRPVENYSRKERCRRLQMVFQDPFSSMNPKMLVGDIVAEGLKALYPEMSREERREQVERLLLQVGLPKEAVFRYPHEFSGGQRQRICIARALAVRPKLIVCDEPTSALDVSTQKLILELLKEIQQEYGVSYLFISHDLALVAEIAHRVVAVAQSKAYEVAEISFSV